MRRERRELSQDVQREHSLRVVSHIQRRLDVRNLNTVACYLANDGEIDLQTLMDWLFERGVQVAVPSVREQTMDFVLLRQDQEIVTGRWGIREPRTRKEISLSQISIVFAPLVAFSSRGDRLGRGGGYYDKAMSGLKKPLFVGVGHEIQRCDELRLEEKDILLDAVVTEAGWQNFQPNLPHIREGA